MKIREKTFNIETGEETIIDRDETTAEKKLREKTEADFVAKQAEVKAKATARQALLDKLGITADEAKLLLG